MPMVSSMESNHDDLARQMQEIERGRVAPWIASTPLPPWWPWLFGVWSGTYTLTMGLLDGVVQALVQLLHVLVMIGAIGVWRRVRGTYPRGRQPRELTPSLVVLMAGAAAVALLAWGTYAIAGTWAAAAVAAVLATVLVAAYERMFLRAAQRVRDRLG